MKQYEPGNDRANFMHILIGFDVEHDERVGFLLLGLLGLLLRQVGAIQDARQIGVGDDIAVIRRLTFDQ